MEESVLDGVETRRPWCVRVCRWMCVLVEFEHSVPRVHSGRHFCPVVVILINPGPGDIKHSVCVLFRKFCLKKQQQIDSGVFLPLHYPMVFLCLALFCIVSSCLFQQFIWFPQFSTLCSECLSSSHVALWFPGRSLDEDSFRDAKQPMTVKQKQTFENRAL